MSRALMTRFHARDGAVMFAFDPATDPVTVMVEFAWAWRGGQQVCSMAACPTTDGLYCVECHSISASAVFEARARMAAERDQ